jgi:hypothetical protein
MIVAAGLFAAVGIAGMTVAATASAPSFLARVRVAECPNPDDCTVPGLVRVASVPAATPRLTGGRMGTDTIPSDPPPDCGTPGTPPCP